MAETAQLNVQLNLTGNFNKDVAKATASVKSVQKQTKSLGSDLKGSVLTGVGLGAGVTGFTLLAQGIGRAVDAIGDAIHGAEEEDAAIAQLSRSIAENDQAWRGNVDAVEKVIAARQDLAFSDDEQRESLRALVAVTKDVDKALAVQRTAMDLARLKGMNLADATTLLGKVYGGNVGILSRYGIQLRKGATATEALAEIQKRAAGQAETYADSAIGKVTRRQIEASNAAEDLGRALIPLDVAFNDMATGGIRLFADTVGKLTSAGVGGMPELIADLERTARGFQGLKGPTEDTGDLFEDLRNSAADLGLLPEFAKEREWRTALGSIQKELSLTDDQIKVIITTSTQLGLSLDQTIDSLEGTGEAARDSEHELHAQRLQVEMFTKAHYQAQPAVYGLGVSIKDAEKATREYRKAARSTSDAIKDMADNVDLSKGSFKDFWEEQRAQQKRTEFFIRNPDAVRNELNKIERAIAQSEREKQRLEREGGRRANAAALQLIDQRLSQLRSRQQEFRALGVTYGNAAEQGMEQGFAPKLVAQINAVFGGVGGAIKTRNKGENATGGVLMPGDYGTVGERGIERVWNKGGMTVIEPMSGGGSAPMRIDVTVRPTIPAYEVNREIGRIGTTRRSGAGVL